MAISPGIPTSFVPRQPNAAERRAMRGGRNVFLVVALFIFGFAVAVSGATYAYDRYLNHSLQAKAEELAEAQRQVNEEQVEEFIRLRDRLTYGRDLLDSHVALSQVFDVLEAQTLANVRFSELELTVADDHTAQIDIEGTARSFNALAAQSNAFASEKGIRRAIFSDIVVNTNNTVNFTLTADLDTRLIIWEGTDVSAAPVTGPAVAPTSSQTAPQAPAAATGTPQTTP